MGSIITIIVIEKDLQYIQPLSARLIKIVDNCNLLIFSFMREVETDPALDLNFDRFGNSDQYIYIYQF
jgi:hypothetical protein